MSMALTDLSIPISIDLAKVDADLTRTEKRVQATEEKIVAAQAQAERQKVDNVVKAESAKTEAIKKRAMTETELQRKSLQETGRVFEDIQKITKMYAVATAALGAVTAGTEGWKVATALVAGDSEKIVANVEKLKTAMAGIPVVGQSFQLGTAIGGGLMPALGAIGGVTPFDPRGPGGPMGDQNMTIGALEGKRRFLEQEDRDIAAMQLEQQKRNERANERKLFGESMRSQITDVKEAAALQGFDGVERAAVAAAQASGRKVAALEDAARKAKSLEDTELQKEIADAIIVEQERLQREVAVMRDKAAMEELERTRQVSDAKRKDEQDREDAAQKELEASDRDVMDNLERTRKIADAKRDMDEEQTKSLKEKEEAITSTQAGLDERLLRSKGYGFEADVLAAMNDADRKKSVLQDKLDNDYNSKEEEDLIKVQMKQVDEEKNLRIQEIGNKAFKAGQISMSRTAFGGGGPRNPMEAKAERTNELLSEIRNELRGGAKAA